MYINVQQCCDFSVSISLMFSLFYFMHNNYKIISKMLFKYFRQSNTTGNFSFLKNCHMTCIYNNQTIEWFNNLGVTQFCESLKQNLSPTDIFKNLYNQVFPWQPFLILNTVIRSFLLSPFIGLLYDCTLTQESRHCQSPALTGRALFYS